MITVNGWCAGGCGGGGWVGVHNGDVSEKSMGEMGRDFCLFYLLLKTLKKTVMQTIFFSNSDFIQNNTCQCSLSNIS